MFADMDPNQIIESGYTPQPEGGAEYYDSDGCLNDEAGERFEEMLNTFNAPDGYVNVDLDYDYKNGVVIIYLDGCDRKDLEMRVKLDEYQYQHEHVKDNFGAWAEIIDAWNANVKSNSYREIDSVNYHAAMYALDTMAGHSDTQDKKIQLLKELLGAC